MTKLEEVARAIYCRMVGDRDAPSWDFLSQHQPKARGELMAIALAAIKALREPSAHMSVEGHEAAEKALGAMFHYPLADPVWEAMVSALLSEAEQEHE